MLGAIVRFIVAALVLLGVGMITPGMAVGGFWPALMAAIAIALVGWLVESFVGRGASPYGRGISGFIAATLVIWLIGMVIPGFNVTLVGAMIAALIIGLVDAVVPTDLR